MTTSIRLGAAAIAVLILAPAAWAGEWAVDRDQDPMTDKARVTMLTEAAEGAASLVVGCNGDDFRMFVMLKPAAGVPTLAHRTATGWAVQGRWRIDEDKPKGITYWTSGDDLSLLTPHANFSSNAKGFLKQLEGHSRVLFQVTGAGTHTFDLAGLNTQELAACYSK